MIDKLEMGVRWWLSAGNSTTGLERQCNSVLYNVHESDTLRSALEYLVEGLASHFEVTLQPVNVPNISGQFVSTWPLSVYQR